MYPRRATKFGLQLVTEVPVKLEGYYKYKAGETFKTPEFVFTLSDTGTSQASRNLHDWARRYQLWKGEGRRMTLLNNWENTGFDFDQKSLAELMKDAKDLGVDMFLLDDGWFANK